MESMNWNLFYDEKILYYKITQNPQELQDVNWETQLRDVIVPRNRFLSGKCVVTVLKGHLGGYITCKYVIIA